MSKLQPSVSERIGTQQQPRSPAPRLLWPSIDYRSRAKCRDLPHFPAADRVRQRRCEGERDIELTLVAFTSAVEHSLKCVLVLDPHFDEVGADALAPALAGSLAPDIRLLTGGRKHDCEKLRQTLEEFRNMDRPISKQAQVRWSTKLDKDRFPFLHDRFAIVDGALWHFGSTVGGGHSGLTAASGPWPENDAHGWQFFDKCWRELNA